MRVSYNGITLAFQANDFSSILNTRSNSPIAQLVEQLTVNQSVAGSSPARGAMALSFSPAQDTALSRRKHGFKSHWGRHRIIIGDQLSWESVCFTRRKSLVRFQYHLPDRRENRYSDGAHNPVSVGSTPTPATKKIEKNLTFLSEAGTIVVKDKRLSNSCFRKWFPFGNVLVPATV